MTSESGRVPTIEIGVNDTNLKLPVSVKDEDSTVELGVHELEKTSRIPVKLNDESSVIKLGLHDVKSNIHLKYAEFGGVANSYGSGTYILRGTTSYWNEQHGLIAEKDVIYIYTDNATVDNGDGTYTIYPAIKIGDGTSYLIDMPFIDGELSPIIQNHINDSTIHVTAAEKDFWNNKWRGYIVNSSPENLVFTTE